jgi:hypothetical protein
MSLRITGATVDGGALRDYDPDAMQSLLTSGLLLM